MNEPIVWIISHGGQSRTKGFIRQLTNAGLINGLIVYADCKYAGNRSTFNLSLVNNRALKTPSPNEKDLKAHIDRFAPMEISATQLLERIDEINALSFVDNLNHSAYIDGNIGVPNLSYVSNLFHLITQRLGMSKLPSVRYGQVMPIISNYLTVYAFSQNEDCCEEVCLYLKGHESSSYIEDGAVIQGSTASVSIRGFACDLTEIIGRIQNPETTYYSNYYKYDSLNDVIEITRQIHDESLRLIPIDDSYLGDECDVLEETADFTTLNSVTKSRSATEDSLTRSISTKEEIQSAEKGSEEIEKNELVLSVNPNNLFKASRIKSGKYQDDKKSKEELPRAKCCVIL
ncbi:MAG: hypothetical protein P1U74_08055 [Legionellaceae bacterium]|nr:hypothetical protein [Legionellaceae bacterium]